MPPISEETQKNSMILATDLCDPFVRLPVELLYEVLDGLPSKDLLPFVMASRRIQSMSMEPQFWKRRIEIDMPWLWELREFALPKYNEDIDWHSLYSILCDHSYTGSWKYCIHQVRNRDEQAWFCAIW
jgi:hypothetical protein